ncbi:hypothetical protein BU23DRAFT_598108 [Bimuria novae-zelandiae CBS 107.79]|uniref:Zn(2)-C6 fungal-type domain-containing protein n=1 Tax=Bimuria novae-zelandiae CBS 107.79 TaxID=1447943 RepID=A0A6A5VCA8_9PLEO|nr:hypothetical protein BU23DRAFT_598108 [Bimuria novae-zelandiae CBS 107.79]
MSTQGQAQIYRMVEYNPERQRRLRRTKTGCITCKIRRVRCDEQKPECNRCVSTGRKCDGYNPKDKKHIRAGSGEASSSSTSPEPLPTQLKIALPRENVQELRSYRFFLDVTAPAIAGVFEIDFWLTYIPRACHVDSAIWHAVVSLGAVHEASIHKCTATTYHGMEFALQQFNTAINYLVHSSPPCDTVEEKWRALTASVVFTYLCSFQGLYNESRIHLNAAKSLIEALQEIEKESNSSIPARTAKRNMPASKPLQFNTVPVPYDDLFSVVACLESTDQLLHLSGANDGPEILEDADAYITWRTYSAPSTPVSSKTCNHGKCSPSRATPANLRYAGKAIRSLLNGLMALSQRDAGDVARLVLQAEQSVLGALIRRQQPYIRAFRELSAAIDTFVADTFTNCACFGPYAAPTPSLRKAIDVLRIYHATCYPLFLNSPTDDMLLLDTYQPLITAREDSVRDIVYQRQRGRILDQGTPDNSPAMHLREVFKQSSPSEEEALAMHFEQAITLAETVLQDSTPQTRPEYSSDFVPTLPTTAPLLIMAHVSGIPPELRKRVIDLLRNYPKEEVFLESTFAAALCELILGLEASDRHGTLEIGGAAPETALSNKVYGAGVTFTQAHGARVAIQTWDDWLAGRPGREEMLTW